MRSWHCLMNTANDAWSGILLALEMLVLCVGVSIIDWFKGRDR